MYLGISIEISKCLNPPLNSLNPSITTCPGVYPKVVCPQILNFFIFYFLFFIEGNKSSIKGYDPFTALDYQQLFNCMRYYVGDREIFYHVSTSVVTEQEDQNVFEWSRPQCRDPGSSHMCCLASACRYDKLRNDDGCFSLPAFRMRQSVP